MALRENTAHRGDERVAEIARPGLDQSDRVGQEIEEGPGLGGGEGDIAADRRDLAGGEKVRADIRHEGGVELRRGLRPERRDQPRLAEAGPRRFRHDRDPAGLALRCRRAHLAMTMVVQALSSLPSSRAGAKRTSMRCRSPRTTGQ